MSRGAAVVTVAALVTVPSGLAMAVAVAVAMSLQKEVTTSTVAARGCTKSFAAQETPDHSPWPLRSAVAASNCTYDAQDHSSANRLHSVG